MKRLKACIATLILLLFSDGRLVATKDYRVSYDQLNREVLGFARANLGLKVGRGECWDLPAGPLMRFNAVWDQRFEFGLKIASGDMKGHYTHSGCRVEPGDIIKFWDVVIEPRKISEHRTTGRYHRLGYPLHIAVIELVDSRNEITILHQNVYKKRFVIRETINLADMTRGSYIIYRPYRKI